jgi:hypothetical protein
MGAVAVIIAVAGLIFLALFLLKVIHDGPPTLKFEDIPPWSWGMTKVAPMSCIAFASDAPSLQNQQPLPEKLVIDENGKQVRAVPQMGTAAHFPWIKSSTAPGGWARSTQETPFTPGTAKDCCTFLMDAGGRKSAVFDTADASCYLFDYMSPLESAARDAGNPQTPYTAKDFKNVFPLHGGKFKSIDEIRDKDGKFVMMTACGGEGQVPCDFSGTTVAEATWPPETRGCSQLGGSGPTTPPNITLFRTPVQAPLPFDDVKPWEICQTEAYIRNFGFQPKDIGKCLRDKSCFNNKTEWHWPSVLPVFDARDTYNPNTSNARYRF